MGNRLGTANRRDEKSPGEDRKRKQGSMRSIERSKGNRQTKRRIQKTGTG